VPNLPRFGNFNLLVSRTVSGCRAGGFPLSSGVSKAQTIFKYWLPPLLWMTVIFTASADTHSAQHSSRFFLPLLHWLFPRMSAEHIDTCHYIFRKCCHLTEYAVLGILLWRAVRRPWKSQPQPWRWSQAGLALGLVLLYSISDEIHQAFVPTRTAHATDVLIDTSGAAIGLLLLWSFGKLFKRW
jgi:VanZ family protein